jgi:hypothetical protein
LVIAFATHRPKAPSASPRLTAMRQAERDQKSNELATYRQFAQRIEHKKAELLERLTELKRQGKRIYGLGAPVKGNTLLNYCGIGREYLDYLLEKNELRRGLYSPGMHIPLAIEKEIVNLPDVYFVLAWNFKKEILANNQHLIAKGVEFYFPINPGEIAAS